MKLRTILVIAILTILLAACNFSLAEDITPPPGYVSPTPAPTLGPIYPEQAPIPAQGASIYKEKCAPCHGNTGLGDGPQGLQLSVTVPGLGIEEIAHPAIPSEWFITVKQGRIQRFMPPFSGSLSDQQIWDVISYAFTLSTTPEQIAQGKDLFKANCAECHGETGNTIASADLSNQEFMAKRTINDLTRAITNGANGMPPFSNLTEDETLAIAAYARTLTFGQALATPTPEPSATATPEVATNPEATPETQITEEATPEEPVSSLGAVRGTFTSASGTNLPGDLPVTLRVFEHGQDANGTPVEILTLETTLNKNGTYEFTDVELGEGRFFYTEIVIDDILTESEVAVSEVGMKEVDLGETLIYDTTTDLSVLSLDQFHVFFDFTQENVLTVVEIYIMSNTSDKTLVVDTDLQSIPFVVLPEGASGFGIDGGDGPFIGTETGFAMPPSETQYQLQVFFQLPYDKKADIAQLVALNTKSGSIIVPDGVKFKSATLTSGQPQEIGGQSYTIYELGSLSTGDTVEFSLSGSPKSSTSDGALALNTNTGILIGVGGLGLALIALGVFFYLRDRNAANEEDELFDDIDDEDDLEPEQIMDAIIALDDQYRNGNMSKEAYDSRREELKALLKKNL